MGKTAKLIAELERELKEEEQAGQTDRATRDRRNSQDRPKERPRYTQD